MDKISILEIKSDKICAPSKLANVMNELQSLREVSSKHIVESHELAQLQKQLKEVNIHLWSIEDDIRLCEKRADFGGDFVQLARSVYKFNDRRAELKKEISVLLGSSLMEEKSYEEYSQD
jgi:hypothetical protein